MGRDLIRDKKIFFWLLPLTQWCRKTTLATTTTPFLRRPYGFSESAGEECRMEDSLLQADILLWKKRSRASLRKHYSVRNLAARELYDTEKSFVEGLEFLITKYMRPLRQPLECTLIESGLADKIFYKVPEVLAHHQ
ncbi:hypothetical protein COOONC_14250, partial [Cooperia oncophora]